MRRGRVPELGIILLGFQIVRNIGFTNLPPVTLLAILAQVAVYLQFLVVPRLCLSGEAVWERGEYLRLLVPAIRHTHDIHLYYNMVSLAWKGLHLERRLGSFRFVVTLVLLTLASSLAYVGLALVLADLTEDYSYMQQCAIGFSGVLFALKVINNYERDEDERESFFGFSIPMRYSVWIELLVIQVMVPKASFLGHMGGILAGLLFAVGPLGGINSLVRSSVGGLRWLRPGSLLLSAGFAAAYAGVFNDLPLRGCVPTSNLHYQSWRQGLSLAEVKMLGLAPLHHLGNIHLTINIASFLVKARRMESKLGFISLLVNTAASILLVSPVYWMANRVVYEVTGSYDHLHNCTVGLSGPLFALKVLTLLCSSGLDLTTIYELVELAVLLEKSHRVYHIAGLVTGVILAVWKPGTRSRWGSGGGRRLGGGADQRYPSPSPAGGTNNFRTRSWGYGGRTGRGHNGNYGWGDGVDGHYDQQSGSYQASGHHDQQLDPNREQRDLDEAINRSRQSYYEEQRGYANDNHLPSAPPPEDDEFGGRQPSNAGGWAMPSSSYTAAAPADDGREARRPPQYTDGGNENPPPPPSGGVTMDELRRRRLQRFS